MVLAAGLSPHEHTTTNKKRGGIDTAFLAKGVLESGAFFIALDSV
jgi:hypothetical protein